MSQTQVQDNSAFAFQFFNNGKTACNGTHWNTLFSAKKTRKPSSESAFTATTHDESFTDSSKDGSSPNLESPNNWDSRMSIDSAETREDSVLNSALKPKKKAVVDDSKYKTELCKKFEGTGYCPYGRKCKFAHGKEELNEKLLSNKRRYKSKLCNSFHTIMTCPYGSRCLFAHEERTMEEIQSDHFYEKFIFCPDLVQEVSKNKRLSCFENVTKQSVNSNTVRFVGTLKSASEDDYDNLFNQSSFSM